MSIQARDDECATNLAYRHFFQNGETTFLTFEEWLTEPLFAGAITPPYPDGFVESGFAYSHWDAGNPLSWARHSWETSKIKAKWDYDHRRRIRV